MTSKWERRQRKQDKARYGMRVSGRSIKSMPTGARYTYIVEVEGVGWYTVTASNEQDARNQVRKVLPRAKRKHPYSIRKVT